MQKPKIKVVIQGERSFVFNFAFLSLNLDIAEE
jgi:hypothetical protein